MPAHPFTYDELAAAALRELARRRVSDTPRPETPPMHGAAHDPRLDALAHQMSQMERQQVILIDLIKQLTVEVEALTQALTQGRQGSAGVWPRL